MRKRTGRLVRGRARSMRPGSSLPSCLTTGVVAQTECPTREASKKWRVGTRQVSWFFSYREVAFRLASGKVKTVRLVGGRRPFLAENAVSFVEWELAFKGLQRRSRRPLSSSVPGGRALRSPARRGDRSPSRRPDAECWWSKIIKLQNPRVEGAK